VLLAASFRPPNSWRSLLLLAYGQETQEAAVR
jgi:hypothetical protein